MVSAEKAAMRRRLRRLRAQLSGRRQAASEMAAAFAPLERWSGVDVASGYIATGSEIDPGPLLQRLAARGVMIVLPVVVERGAPLVFREAVGLTALECDAADLPAPPPTAAEAVPDLIIAPLLAFDARGGRLGQGGGYYDRTLTSLRTRRRVTVVGLAYAGQEVSEVPTGPLDEPMDAILTETGYREV